MNNENEPWPSKLVRYASDEPNAKHDNRRRESCCSSDDDESAREGKSNVKVLIPNGRFTMMEEQLDDILGNLFQNTKK